MKPKFLLATVVIAVSVLTANAQLLWKVTAPGSDNVSYIFGTHHLAPITVIDSVNGLREALKNIDTLYGEVEMKSMYSPETASLIRSYTTTPADSTLSKLLTSSQIDSVGAVLSKYAGGAVDMKMLETTTPVAINTNLVMLQAMKSFPTYNPNQQLDMEIQKIAAAEGKKVAGLETVELQLRKLMGAPLTEQAAELMNTIRHDSEFTAEAIAMSKAYREGNLEKLYKSMVNPVTGMDEASAERLLWSRNDSWIELLSGLLPSASIMIVVGAGHLPGERGILKMLSQKGFKVTPVE